MTTSTCCTSIDDAGTTVPYVPDPLTDRRYRFDGDVAADVADAEAAIR